MTTKISEKLKEAFVAVFPVVGIVLVLSILVLPMDLGAVSMFLTGSVFLIVGMALFQLGAEIAMTPIGEGVGVQIAKTRRGFWIFLVAFTMGIMITISEPDLQVLAEQVPSVPNFVLIFTVAIGVGIFLALAVLRIRYQIDLSVLLIGSYGILFLLSFFVPSDFFAVAFDSGGVTTGPMTVPFIMALGVGLSSVRGDKDAASNSFGLVALSSVGPILAVMILGIFYRPTGADYALEEMVPVYNTQDVAAQFSSHLWEYIEEVFLSLLPVIVVFWLFQLAFRRFQKRQLQRITVGIFYTFLGLVLFLCGVNVGFAPVGALLGKGLSSLSFRWILVPIGMLIGYFIVKAEPAIQVLNSQVESVTDGAISVKAMNRSMSIGVSVSVGLSLFRTLAGIPILYILIPGYVIALGLSRVVPKIFVGIAFDSGGVASGPMTSTFLLPLSIGTCLATGRNLMTEAFGVVALVALTPLIAIQVMGLVYRFKMGSLQKKAGAERRLPEGCDVVVDLEVQ